MRQLIRAAMLASAVTLAACGSKSASPDSAQVAAYVAPSANASAASGSTSDPKCVTTADVKEALGFDVRELTKGMKHYGPLWSCGFAATDEDALPGVTVQITIEPGSEADTRFTAMREAVTAARGRPTEPDAIPLGERGMAYTTSSATMAAASSKGRVYSVELRYGAVAKFTDKQPGVVAILRKLM